MVKIDLGPQIPPVAEGEIRPFWSVMIPTYNRLTFLEQTLKSVLEQGFSPDEMQIEVVDNCSTKCDIKTLVQDIGLGRISFYRQPRNVGMVGNWNTCIARSRGQWVHILHDDDFVLPGFYQQLQISLEQEPTVGAAFCRYFYWEEESSRQSLSSLEQSFPGILQHWLEKIAIGQRIQCPAIAVKRSVYKDLGGFCEKARSAADWEMWKRIAVSYPVWYEPKPLACYRLHTGSDTSEMIRSGVNVANARRAIEITNSYLPRDRAEQLTRIARLNYGHLALKIAQKTLIEEGIDAAVATILEGLNCSDSPEVISELCKKFATTETSSLLMAIKSQGDKYQGSIDQLLEVLKERLDRQAKAHPVILIDGVFFQLYNTGIARLWRTLLEELSTSSFTRNLIVLDRAETAPKIDGLNYRTIPAYDYNDTDADRAMLQKVCEEERASLFISTYYTTPISTSSIFMTYDMIPEVLGSDFTKPMWREKHHGIQHASSYLAISDNTARDLVKFFPDISQDSVRVAHCGVNPIFSPASFEEVEQFKFKYGIAKPYFLLVAPGTGYKNAPLFFKAFARLYTKFGFDLVCTGNRGFLEDELRNEVPGIFIHTLPLSDEELRLAYAGAVALVYPSMYEGFGLPVLEAIACGCPVITTPNASLPEVAGEAALYVKDDDVEGMMDALCEVQKPSVRKALIAAGLEQAKKFSWSKMAEVVKDALIDATLLPLNLREENWIVFPDWSQSEEAVGLGLQEVIRAIARYPNRTQMTLLIDIQGISQEDANLLVSGVAMNLLLEENLEGVEEVAISFVEQLGEIQWEALFPRLQGRLVLECDNRDSIAQVGAEGLSAYTLEDFA